MATIVNTPGGSNDSGTGGWAVAVIILLVVLVGGFFLWGGFGNRDSSPTTDINVTIPTPEVGGGGEAAPAN